MNYVMNYDKLNNLRKILLNMNRVVICFSGGIDSTFLLKIALDTLGKNNVLAVMAISPLVAEKEIIYAKDVAENLNANLIQFSSIEMMSEYILNNSLERCYHCKKSMLKKILEIASDHNISYVLEGSNLDDVKDFRPGYKAVKELEVRSPLQDAGFTKTEIREAAKNLELINWDKPSMPCLASRIPYNEKITLLKLKQIETAELFLESLGFKNLRVRHCGTLARIEIGSDFLQAAIANPLRQKIISKFKEIGFKYITLDLEGFRTGSLNE